MPISSKMRPTIVMVLGKRPERREGTSEKLLVRKMSHASVRTVSRRTPADTGTRTSTNVEAGDDGHHDRQSIAGVAGMEARA